MAHEYREQARVAGKAAQPISVRVRGAVELTGLSRSRIYELMKAGEIDYVKVGSSTLILMDSLRNFVEGRRH